MEREEKDKLQEAKEKLRDAERELLQIYLDCIREEYDKANADERKAILAGLERVLSGEEVTKYIKPFDPEKARQIRKMANFSQAALAREIGTSQTVISYYETGKARSLYYSKSEKTTKYLRWLDERGYNPSNIDFSKPQE